MGFFESDVEQAEVLVLKLELLAEARKCSGRVLVMDESSGDGGLASEGGLANYWECNISPATVFTPRELFEMLSLEGLRVQFHRVPITDEQAPQEKDFDTILAAMRAGYKQSPGFACVFNCALTGH